jgi:hypothetical protein
MEWKTERSLGTFEEPRTQTEVSITFSRPFHHLVEQALLLPTQKNKQQWLSSYDLRETISLEGCEQ